MPAFQILDWDTQAFGFKVATITEATHTAASLGDCLNDLRREHVTLAYWFADDQPELTEIAENFRGLLFDRKATYATDLSQHQPSNPSPQLQTAQPSDLEQLEHLAIQSGIHSRFARDPRFPREHFELLYREWIRKSLAGELADRVILWRDDDESVLGLITVKLHPPVASIGLLGVDGNHRGRGIGRQLVQEALRLECVNGVARSYVVTQSENLAACALYERCGFSLQAVQRVHHFWLTS